jgi:hypothetical protein
MPFFENEACRNYLMHALIIVYVDSEKIEEISPSHRFIKFKYRTSAANIMEYIW